MGSDDSESMHWLELPLQKPQPSAGAVALPVACHSPWPVESWWVQGSAA